MTVTPSARACFSITWTGRPVINNTLRGILETARDLPEIGTVYGARHGIEGVLKEELLVFQKSKGYLPRVFLVHMNPRQEKEIEAEVEQLSDELGTSITLAYEGLVVQL